MAFFLKCANGAFSVVPRKGDGDVENWNRVWVRYGLLFWYTFGTICCFFFHSDLPSAHCTTCWRWSFHKHRVCPSVHPSVWSECLLSAWRNLGSLATHWAHSKNWSDWEDAQADPCLRWAIRSFCWLCRAVAHLFHFGLSHLRQQYWFLLFRCVLFPETPRESDGIYVSMHVYACLRLLCGWVVVLTFIFHDGRRVTNWQLSFHSVF